MPGEDYHTSTVSGAAAHAAQFSDNYNDEPSRAECEDDAFRETVDAALKDHFRETLTLDEMIDLFFEITDYDERTTMFNDELEERLGRD